MDLTNTVLPSSRWIRSFAYSVLATVLLSGLATSQSPNAEQKVEPKRADSEEISTDTLSDSEIESINQRIQFLIEQLGSDNYRKRMEAQAELERIGVRSLDLLHLASFHSDPQIASTARFIVQSNQFSWAWETDPLSVRQILSNYSSAQLSERSVYVDQLSRLPRGEGFQALCRLVRYETQGCLSKRAALILMRGTPLIGQSIRERRDALYDTINGGQSDASRWVVKFASQDSANQDKSFDIQWWKRMIDQEVKLLASRSSETSIDINQDLRRWIIEQIIGTEDPSLRPDAIAIAQSILNTELESGKLRPRAFELAHWAIKTKLPEFVQMQHATLNELMLHDARFGYLLAESYAIQGKKEISDRIASLTLERIICDEKGERQTKPIDKPEPVSNFNPFQDKSARYSRMQAAMDVTRQGRLDWAEAEYRKAIGNDWADENTIDFVDALSRLLHSMDRNIEAADILAPFVKRFENEPRFRTQLLNQSFRADDIVLNYYQYRGDQAAKQNDLEKARELYLKGIEGQKGLHALGIDQAQAVDVFIGLYRVCRTEEERAQWREKSSKMTTEIRNAIRKHESDLKRSDPRAIANIEQELAKDLNMMAWLIANTEGNAEEAVIMSRRACTIVPDNASLVDTLAHCYFAVGKYAEAVEQQKRAVSLAPHQPDLKVALAKFEKKLSDQ